MKYFKGKNSQFFMIAGHMFILFAVTLILSNILSIWADNNKKIIQVNYQVNSKSITIKPNPDVVSSNQLFQKLKVSISTKPDNFIKNSKNKKQKK
jgi:hypothetical protein